LTIAMILAAHPLTVSTSPLLLSYEMHPP
jgi:hypothetical protein